MGSKSDRSSSTALHAIYIEDWAILVLGLEARLAGVLNAIQSLVEPFFTEPFSTEPFSTEFSDSSDRPQVP